MIFKFCIPSGGKRHVHMFGQSYVGVCLQVSSLTDHLSVPNLPAGCRWVLPASRRCSGPWTPCPPLSDESTELLAVVQLYHSAETNCVKLLEKFPPETETPRFCSACRGTWRRFTIAAWWRHILRQLVTQPTAAFVVPGETRRSGFSPLNSHIWTDQLRRSRVLGVERCWEEAGPVRSSGEAASGGEFASASVHGERLLFFSHLSFHTLFIPLPLSWGGKVGLVRTPLQVPVDPLWFLQVNSICLNRGEMSSKFGSKPPVCENRTSPLQHMTWLV